MLVVFPFLEWRAFGRSWKGNLINDFGDQRKLRKHTNRIRTVRIERGRPYERIFRLLQGFGSSAQDSHCLLKRLEITLNAMLCVVNRLFSLLDPINFSRAPYRLHTELLRNN